MRGLRVIADDLTGACDVGAELLPWPGGVVVLPDPAATPPAPGPLVVANTQSRTLPAAEAGGRVARVLAGAAGSCTILLKKIDTGLRGPLGAELDAAMDAVGAGEAFVLPAIPEVGRTTERGCQLIDGVPVHETAFARDPQNPVRESHVASVLEATGRRPTGEIALAAVRAADGGAAAVAAARASGATVLVCDARTDDDLARMVRVLLARPRPVVLAGSIGLARAVRAALAGAEARPPDPSAAPGGTGVLGVVGSAHPTAHAQAACAAETAGAVLLPVSLDDPAAAGRGAAARLRAGASVLLLAPATPVADGSPAVLAALRAAAVAALTEAPPRGLLIVGGETAHAVLAGLRHPPLVLERRVAPLAVRGRVAAGRWAGLPVVTKGGSSGPIDLVAGLVRALRGGAT